MSLTNLIPSDVLAAPTDKLRVERRRVLRQSALEQGGLIPVDLGGHGGVVLDVSATGLRAHSLHPLPVGSAVAVEIWMPNSDECLTAQAEVIWINDHDQAGLKFISPPENWGVTMTALLASFTSVAPADPEERCPDVFDVETLLREAFPAETHTVRNTDLSYRPRVELARTMVTDVVNDALSITDADGAALAFARRGRIYCIASAGLAPAVGTQMNPNRGLSGACYSSGRAVVCTDAQNDARVNPELAREADLCSIAVVPILYFDRTVGLLQVLSHQRSAFADVHVELLTYMAQQFVARLTPKAVGTNPQREREPAHARVD